jgi:hypothetical protein
MVQESGKGTRHVVLFADAADAEEPGDYERLLATLTPIGITVSVIGLGSESDQDAAFLKDVAARGQGRAIFTSSVDELPRLFAQEAITVARSSFVTEPTAARTLPDMALLGESPASAFPSLDGYNLTYLRPGATMGVVTNDEYQAPVLAFWHRGLGRVAALTAEVDGQYSQRLNAWQDFHRFSVGLGRWLLGGEPPSGVQATIERQGGQGIVRVELDPGRTRTGADAVRTATATIVPPEDPAGGRPRRLPLTWTGEDTLEGRFPMQKAGLYLGAVQLGSGTVLPLAPLTLPYSPEFEPRPDPGEGHRILREMARVTGGVERTAWDDVFSARRLRHRQVRDLVIPLTLLLLLLHLSEIGGRRLLLFDAARAYVARRFGRRSETREGGRAPDRHGWLRGLRFPRLRPATPRPDGPSPDPTGADPGVTVGQGPRLPPVQPVPSPLARAKAKARGRMGK